MTGSSIQCFYNIPLTPKRASVLGRLGIPKNAPVDPALSAMLEAGLRQARILGRPTGLYRLLTIAQRTVDSVTLENEINLQSQSLSRLLQNSAETVLMAATVGSEIVDAIGYEITQKDAAHGVILDAVASETADAVLDWLMDYLNTMLAKTGRKLTKHRYSPGYGDLPLAYQKPIFETLKLSEVGINLTEKYMLVPEKSVIAIAGIEPKE